MPAVPTSWETEAGRLFEPWSLEPAQEKIARIYLKKKKKKSKCELTKSQQALESVQNLRP